MADTVRALMEAMVPELEDYARRGYFERAEIDAIVKRREHFEYQLRRRNAIKSDFLRCGRFLGARGCAANTMAAPVAAAAAVCGRLASPRRSCSTPRFWRSTRFDYAPVWCAACKPARTAAH